ncbi:MAG: SsrA-binding protein SmpB [Candidatus Cloacimonetes bacterium]|nr:SsrA-binding protein SmpB [Candidatus Cloacimonadota bacterium]
MDTKDKRIKEFKNRKASHNYYFVQELEAGIVLMGTEIKSIRAGKVSFMDCYALIDNGEVWLYNLHISPYIYAGYGNHEPDRKRKLLLNRREISRLKSKVDEQGMTLIPKDIYINGQGKVKLTLCLAKGKRLYDKRDVMQEKTAKRDQERIIKNIRL